MCRRPENADEAGSVNAGLDGLDVDGNAASLVDGLPRTGLLVFVERRVVVNPQVDNAAGFVADLNQAVARGDDSAAEMPCVRIRPRPVGTGRTEHDRHHEREARTSDHDDPATFSG